MTSEIERKEFLDSMRFKVAEQDDFYLELISVFFHAFAKKSGGRYRLLNRITSKIITNGEFYKIVKNQSSQINKGK